MGLTEAVDEGLVVHQFHLVGSDLGLGGAGGRHGLASEGPDVLFWARYYLHVSSGVCAYVKSSRSQNYKSYYLNSLDRKSVV